MSGIEVMYTQNCDNCGKPFESRDGFPCPQLCEQCSKPDKPIPPNPVGHVD